MDVSRRGLTGEKAQLHLEALGVTTNKNPTPIDPPTPDRWIGIRLGTSAGTTRGFDANTFATIANLIADLLDDPDNHEVHQKVAKQVRAICRAFPIYRS